MTSLPQNSDITLVLKQLLESAESPIQDAITELVETPLEGGFTGDPSRKDLSHLWTPQPGPQMLAYHSEADILFYGGAAGGGKSSLLLGLALTAHQRSIIFRKELKQNLDFVDELTTSILETDKGWSSQRNSWDLAVLTKFPGHRLDFGGLADPGSEQSYKGRPHDFIGFDEGVDYTEHQVRFLSTWNRSTLPLQRCRIVIASNPPAPTSGKQASTGLWLIEFFAPWLDPEYKDPLGLGRPEPGELRWFVRLPGETKDQEWEDSLPFFYVDKTTGKKEEVIPQSRTFIPASVYDNVYLRGTNYLATLLALTEPLRSIMLHGDFSQALSDRPMSLFKANWIRDAMRRWKSQEDLPPNDHPRNSPMTALGLDVARGGLDNTVGAPRHGAYFDTLRVVPGSSTPDGPTAAGFAISWSKDGATIVVDANGAGGAVYDHLNKSVGAACRAYIGSTKAMLRDRTGKFQFTNLRSQSYWKFREALDPSTPIQVSLPDDPDLMTELLAHSFEVRSGKIQITPKESVIEILGRSPDRADSVVQAWSEPHETSWLPASSSRSRRNVDGYSRSQRGNIRVAPIRGPIDYGEDKVI